MASCFRVSVPSRMRVTESEQDRIGRCRSRADLGPAPLPRASVWASRCSSTEGDEHGVTPGLGILPGRIERFPDRTPDGEQLRVPHIGWNTVKFSGDHPMLSKLPDEDCFYFVHSYRAIPDRTSDVVGRVDYGSEFAAAVAREGMFAVQFHPEKSQSAGRGLLDAFAFWVSQC